MGRHGGVCLVVMLVMNLWVTTASPGRVAERLQDGFGHYYMIKDYALGNPAEYQLQPVTNACPCRQWCQTSTVCHSVSVVSEADGGWQCRVSNKPKDLEDFSDRSRLNKTQGAIHFLEIASTDTDIGHSGLRLVRSGLLYNWTYCFKLYCNKKLNRCKRKPCAFAPIHTNSLLRDAVEATEGLLHHIYLEAPGAGQEPLWGEDKIPLSTTEIVNTTILNPALTGKLGYFMRYKSGQVTFYPASVTAILYRCLCLDNPLNI